MNGFDNFGFDGRYFGGNSLNGDKLSEGRGSESTWCRWSGEQSNQCRFDQGSMDVVVIVAD